MHTRKIQNDSHVVKPIEGRVSSGNMISTDKNFVETQVDQEMSTKSSYGKLRNLRLAKSKDYSVPSLNNVINPNNSPMIKPIFLITRERDP